jgi:1,2-phenylacetyl-CoA epoxidase catalytic subunit
MREYLRKSARFQHSEREMVRYFGSDVSCEYPVPAKVKFKAIFEEALHHPFSFTYYTAVYAYSRVARERARTALNANWEVDRSTKRVA